MAVSSDGRSERQAVAAVSQQDLPECIIASSNRYNDIAPYSTHIYYTEPDKWGSILPWEFPQNASKTAEEEFLRKYFDEVEVHMQGGAQGAGNGFKFLKQVWYTIAIWNAEHRIPAIATWWCEQESNRKFMEDQGMLDHICNPEAKPETFFQPTELDMYGHKLLTWVVKQIQGYAKLCKNKVRDRLDSAVSNQRPDSAQKDNATTKSPLLETEPKVEPAGSVSETAATPMDRSSAAQEVATLQEASDPFPSFDNTRSSSRVSIADVVPDGANNLPSRKPGRSVGGRMPSGDSQGRGTDNQLVRDWTLYSPPTFSASPIYAPHSSPGMARDQFRSVSGSSGTLTPRLHLVGPQAPFRQPQGMQTPYMASYARQQPQDYGPTTFTPMASHQPDVMALSDRSNERNYPCYFNNDLQISGAHDRVPEHNGQRRGSQGSRGGSMRGQSRGGRGRNRGSRANMSDDSNWMRISDSQPMEGAPSDFGAFQDANHANRPRRSSAFDERTWRSGTERPQHQPHEQAHLPRNFSGGPGPMQGNSFPNYPTNSTPFPGPFPMDMGRQHRPMTHERRLMPNALPFVTLNQRPPTLVDPRNEHPDLDENTVTPAFIGRRRFEVNILILFHLPHEGPSEPIEDLFRDRGIPVAKVRQSGPIAFVHFNNHEDARRALGLQGTTCDWSKKPLKLEVAREFWDPSFERYQQRYQSNPSPTMYRGGDARRDGTWLPVMHIPPGRDSTSFLANQANHGLPRPTQGDYYPHFASQAPPQGIAHPSGPMDQELRALDPNANFGFGHGPSYSDSGTATASRTSTPKKNKRFNNKKKTAAGYRNNKNFFNEDVAFAAFQGSTINEISSRAEGVTSAAAHDAERGKRTTDSRTPELVENVPAVTPVASEPFREDSFVAETCEKAQLASASRSSPVDSGTPSESEQTPPTGESEKQRGPEVVPETAAIEAFSQPSASEQPVSLTIAQHLAEKKVAMLPPKQEPSEAAGERLQPAAAASTVLPTIVEDQELSNANAKVDHNFVDDSFHTANGSSPDKSNSPAVEKERSENNKAVFEAEDGEDSGADKIEGEKKSSPKPAASLPEPAASLDTRDGGSSPKSQHADDPVQPSSALNAPCSTSVPSVPPTPATVYHTAPTTPMVPNSVTGSRGPENTTAPKKTEKAKGPSQTESFSNFGRKNRSKQTKSKTSSIKGRPREFSKQLASGETSRAVSTSSTPAMRTGELASADVDETNTNDGKGSEPRSDGLAPRPMRREETRSSAPSSHGTSPSKRKGAFSNILGLLSRDPSPDPSQAHAACGDIDNDKSRLTLSESQNPADASHGKAKSWAEMVGRAASTSDDVASIGLDEVQSHASAPGRSTGSTVEASNDAAKAGEGLVGLGISTEGVDSKIANKRKRKKMAKARKRDMAVEQSGSFSGDGDDDGDCILGPQASEDSVTRHARKLSELVKTEYKDTDQRSESSRTLSLATPPASPAPSTPSKKLATIRSQEGKHLLEAPPPRNLHKRRVSSKASIEPMGVEASADDDNGPNPLGPLLTFKHPVTIIVARESDGEGELDPDGDADGKKVIYLFVPLDDARDSDETSVEEKVAAEEVEDEEGEENGKGGEHEKSSDKECKMVLPGAPPDWSSRPSFASIVKKNRVEKIENSAESASQMTGEDKAGT